MEIFRGLDFQLNNSAVSLGKFDGIHRGHRLLLQTILEQKAWVPTVFTFAMVAEREMGTDHIVPRNQIYTQWEKDHILEQIGIGREIIFPFREETRSMLPSVFIREILHEKMGARFLCVGEDFRFGKERSGDVALLQREAQRWGMTVQVFPKLKEGGVVISSSRIRALLKQGDLEQANALLGKPYFVCGEVVHGNALGRTMQMPTANLLPPEEKLLPPFGVYATTVQIGKERYPAVTNVGRKPTVGSREVGVESCLLDFDRDLYGEELCVEFHHFLRPEQKFPDRESLQAQMMRDKEQASDYFH